MQDNVHRVAETAARRLSLIAQANVMWRFEEESENEGDEYTGSYFAPFYVFGLYESAEAAERDALAMLPWLRNQFDG